MQRAESKGRSDGFPTGREKGLVRKLGSMRGLVAGVGGLLCVGGFFFLSLNYLKGQAWAIARDTLPGLSLSGEVGSSLSHGFNRTVLLLLPDAAGERVRLEREIANLSDQTTKSLGSYGEQMYSDEDRDL